MLQLTNVKPHEAGEETATRKINSEEIMTESDIRRQLENGDTRALSDAFAEAQNRLSRIIQFRLNPILSGRVDSDDVLQDAWLAASSRVEHFLGNESMTVFVWLRLIVMQTLSDIERRHLGAKKRDAYREHNFETNINSRSTSISLVCRLHAPNSTPSKQTIRKEKSDQLLNAIEGMDEIDREVLAIRHFEELSNREAAEVLNIEETAASNRYVRALKRLKSILDKHSDFGNESRRSEA